MQNTKIVTRRELPEEFYDILLVMDMGAKKHGHDSWLHGDNPSLESRANYASMSRHLAEAYFNKLDDESGLDALLHLATRALMKYTRKKRGIDHEAEPLREPNRRND
jgi:hypothetical protein